MRSKRTKKIAAILLVMMLGITSLAGCSAADVGFLALSMEAAYLETYTISADLSFEVNPDAISYYVEEKSPPITVKAQITGAAAQANQDIYADLVCKYGINDAKMPNTVRVIVSDEAVYIPVADFIDISMLTYKFNDFSDSMIADIKAGFEKELSGRDYVKVSGFSYEEMAFSQMYMIPGMGDVNASKQLQQLFLDAFTAMFKNLDSGLTKKVANGYSLEINPDNVFKLADNTVKYISENKKPIYNGVIKLVGDLQKYYAAEEEDPGFDSFLEEMAGGEQEFYDAVDEMAASYNEMNEFDREMMKLTLKGSYLKDTLTKTGSTYTDKMEGAFFYQGEKVVSGSVSVSKTAVSKIEKEQLSLLNPIDMIDATTILDQVEKKINHATAMTISWYNGETEYDWTSVDLELVEGSDWAYMDRRMDQGSLYLPMRDICEWFGEEVTWDNKEKKAYVVRGDQKIEMAGKLEYSTLFVKIRDFEKLGYTVNYEYDKDYSEHMVTIKQ